MYQTYSRKAKFCEKRCSFIQAKRLQIPETRSRGANGKYMYCYQQYIENVAKLVLDFIPNLLEPDAPKFHS